MSQTSYAEVITLLDHTPDIERISVTQIQSMGAPFDPTDVEIKRRDGLFTGTILFSDAPNSATAVVREVSLRPTRRATLADVIAWFGYPSAYLFRKANFETPNRGTLMLFYDNQSLIVSMEDMARPQSNWKLDWSLKATDFAFVSDSTYHAWFTWRWPCLVSEGLSL